MSNFSKNDYLHKLNIKRSAIYVGRTESKGPES